MKNINIIVQCQCKILTRSTVWTRFYGWKFRGTFSLKGYKRITLTFYNWLTTPLSCYLLSFQDNGHHTVSVKVVLFFAISLSFSYSQEFDNLKSKTRSSTHTLTSSLLGVGGSIRRGPVLDAEDPGVFVLGVESLEILLTLSKLDTSSNKESELSMAGIFFFT